MTDDLINKYHKDIARKPLAFKQLATKALQVLTQTVPIVKGEVTAPICLLSEKQRYSEVKVSSWFMEALMSMVTENDGMILSEYNTPLVERPIPWTNLRGGGFHTERFKYNLIKNSIPMNEYNNIPVKTIQAINRLQDTRWQINTKILDVMEACIQNDLGWGDLPTTYRAKEYITPCPHDDIHNDFLSEEQKKDRKIWREQTAPHYAKEESSKSQVLAVRMSVNEAKRFKKYDDIYFAYFCDFRGRAYPKATYLSPQGTDFIKSLLHFSEGKVITEEALPYFFMQGANTFGNGLEKKTLQEKVQWVRDNQHHIVECAKNPYDLNSLWHESDEEPWLFLAFCFEYERWVRSPLTFKSHLAVAMDGSCNGLQHLSAMLFDEIGGESVNLTAKPSKGDIYSDVKDEAIKLLEEMSDPLAEMLLNFGITRKAVKRPVMIVPYAGTLNACRKYIDDQLTTEGGLEAFGEKYKEALTLYTETVWQAIGNKILKGREIMTYLSKCARQIIKDTDNTVIEWTTPNGFLVKQERLKQRSVRIETPLGATIKEKGKLRTSFNIPTEIADARAHATGIAPNFVHSLDSCHLQETVNGMDEGTSFAMIHDSFGTHASDTPKMAKVLREVFYNMYREGQVLSKWVASQPVAMAHDTPTIGNLELSKVLEDEFFFS